MDGKGNESIRSELLLSKILNTTSTCIFWKDTQRRFMGVNQAFLDYYGFESEKVLLGKTDEDMGWHANPDPFQNDEWRVLYQGESTYRVHGKCIARGEERDILASKSPIYDNGRIIGLVGTFEDVTTEYAQNHQIRKLMQTIEAVPCGICICRRHFDRTICISANGYFTDLIGGTPERIPPSSSKSSIPKTGAVGCTTRRSSTPASSPWTASTALENPAAAITPGCG